MTTASDLIRVHRPARREAVLGFELPGVLGLADHALAAPDSLYHPNPEAAGTRPALMLAIGASACLLSAGLPAHHTASGGPRMVDADPASDLLGWLAACRHEPHEILDPTEAHAWHHQRRGVVTGVWYLPLSAATARLLRDAASAGVAGLLIDAASLRLSPAPWWASACRPAGRGPGHAAAMRPVWF